MACSANYGVPTPELVEFLEFPHCKALSPLTHYLVPLAAFFCRHAELIRGKGVMGANSLRILCE
jgi:hypothetical protein